MRIRLMKSLKELAPDMLRGMAFADYPFTDREFLVALEESGSVDGRSGWQSAHVAAIDENDEIVALLLLYLIRGFARPSIVTCKRSGPPSLRKWLSYRSVALLIHREPYRRRPIP